MAYIRFAREESRLFHLLFMRDRSAENQNRDDNLSELIDLIAQSNGISREQAKMLHLEMWIYVHGIAAMLATSYFSMEQELISQLVTDAYEGFRRKYVRQEGM